MDETLDLGIGIKAAGAMESQKATKSLTESLKSYVKGIFSVKSATSSMEKMTQSSTATMGSSERTYQKVADSLTSLKSKLLAFAGVYAATDIFRRMFDEGRRVEDMVTSLANRFGSDKIGNQVTRWVNDTVSKLPVARDELQQYIETLDDIALPAAMTDLKGVLEASLATGENLNSVMGQLVSFSKSNDVVGLSEFFSGRISPKEISESLAGAQSIQERVVRLTELMGERFEGNVDRTRRTIKGQFEVLSSIIRLFQQNLIGFAGGGGLYDEIKFFINDFVGWFEDRKDMMIEFAREVQTFLLQTFRFIRKNFLSVGDLATRMVNVIRGFIKQSRELVNPFVLFLAILTDKFKILLSGFIDGFIDFFKELKIIVGATVDLIGEFLSPFMTPKLRNNLRETEKLFAKLFSGENVRTFGEIIGLAAGGVVTFIAVSAGMGKIIGIVKGVTGAWKALGLVIMANPITASITALVAISFLLYKAWKENFFGLRDTLEPVLMWLVSSLKSTKDFLVDLFDSVSSSVMSFISDITPALKKIWTVLEPIASVLLVGFMENIKLVGSVLWSFFKGTWTVVLGGMVNQFQLAWTTISGVIETLLKLITGDFSGAWESFKDMVSGIADILGDQFKLVGSTVMGFFKETGGHILDFFSGFWEGTKGIFMGVFNWFIDKINSYILEPLNSVSSKIGITVPTLNRMGGDEESNGQTVFRPIPEFSGTVSDFQPNLAPAPASSTGVSRTNQFNGNISIQVDGSKDPSKTAEEVRRELETYYRRQAERAE